MKNKTKTIFITTFIIIFIIIISVLIFSGKSKENTKNETPNQNQPFNPFEPTDPNNPNNGSNVDGGGIINWENNTNKQLSRFYQITDFAVAGAHFFEKERSLIQTNPDSPKTETVPTLRYVERVTGHVHQMYLDTKATSKISNSTIPGAHEVLINDTAKTFIYRYVSDSDNKTITSFIATLGKTKGEFLPSDVIDISLSPDKENFFYLTKNSNGVMGFIKSFEETKTSSVFDSPFTEWISQWVNSEKIYLTTKPSWNVNGDLFSLNTGNGTLTKVFGGIKGLTTLANENGSNVLYGISLETGPKLWLFNVKDHSTKSLNSFGLPEKCIWSSDNINIYCAIPNTIAGVQYPDSWYQGLVSFDDYFVKINTETTQRSTLANSKGEIPIDATHLFLDDEENTLFFINKKDSTLWSLDI